MTSIETEFDDLDGLFDLFDGRDRYPEDRSYGIDDDIEDELEALRTERRAKRIKAGVARRRGLDYKGEDL